MPKRRNYLFQGIHKGQQQEASLFLFEMPMQYKPAYKEEEDSRSLEVKEYEAKFATLPFYNKAAISEGIK